MKYRNRFIFMWIVLLTVGCATAQRPTTAQNRGQNLPQLVRFFSIQTVRIKNNALFIAGKGSAAADGGKNTFTAKGPLSSYPAIEMTIKSADAAQLESCKNQIQAARDDNKTIDIRGSGIFTIQSMIDPPLDTGKFTLNILEHCGNPSIPASAPTVTPTTTPSATSAADLVAVPERFLDHKTTIMGRLVAAPQFKDSRTSFTLQDAEQSLACTFVTASLSADARLSLVHAPPGSTLIIEGTLARVALSNGYEFDVSNVIAVRP